MRKANECQVRFFCIIFTNVTSLLKWNNPIFFDWNQAPNQVSSFHKRINKIKHYVVQHYNNLDRQFIANDLATRSAMCLNVCSRARAPKRNAINKIKKWLILPVGVGNLFKFKIFALNSEFSQPFPPDNASVSWHRILFYIFVNIVFQHRRQVQSSATAWIYWIEQ